MDSNLFYIVTGDSENAAPFGEAEAAQPVGCLRFASPEPERWLSWSLPGASGLSMPLATSNSSTSTTRRLSKLRMTQLRSGSFAWSYVGFGSG